MSKVKLFSFDRFAKFGDVLINPSDIVGVSVTKFGHELKTGIYVSENQCFYVSLTIQEIEDEINRALEATRKAHMDVAEEAKEKVQNLMKELNKGTVADPFKMNDFYPEQEN